MDASLAELERAVRDLGALGFQLHTHVAGRPLDDPAFAPVFAKAEELGCMIWLHPARGPVQPDYLSESVSRYGIWWSLGWPFETAAAMARLVYSGVMQRHPQLKILTHHGGGMLPHFAGRLDTIQADDQIEAFERLGGNPIESFKRFYADTAFFGAGHALRSSYEFFGPDQMLFGIRHAARRARRDRRHARGHRDAEALGGRRGEDPRRQRRAGAQAAFR